MNIIQDKFPLVFSGGSPGNVADGQMRIIDTLAKNDVSKKKSVQESNLYDALYTLQIAAEQAEELKKQK